MQSISSIHTPKLQIGTQPSPTLLWNNKPQFGGAISTITAFLSQPVVQPIAEDILGFGVFRTAFDLFRNRFYGNDNSNAETPLLFDEKAQLNTSAARERFFREMGNLFASNFLPALGFTGIFAAASKMSLGKNLTKDFVSLENLDVLKSLTDQSNSKAEFIDNLAKALAPNSGQNETKQQLTQLFSQPEKTTQNLSRKERKAAKASVSEALDNAAVKIINAAKPDHKGLDWTIKTAATETADIELNKFLADAKALARETGKTANWQTEAKTILKRTKRFNIRAMWPAFGLAGLFTLAVPYYNKIITRKVDKTESYPGIKGLKELKDVDQQKNWWQRTFPYFTEQKEKGNIWPFLLALVPLPFAIGLTNNAALRGGQWKKVINSPLNKGFGKRLNQLFQVKHKALASLQQLTALCALVCTARVVTARDTYEMRERLVDTYGAWATWIVLVPMLRRKVVGWINNPEKGIHLLKKAGGEFNEKELKHFFNKNIFEKSNKIRNKIDRWTLGAMVGLLGIAEPYAAIKWTESQVKKDKLKAEKAAWLNHNDTLSISQPLNRKPELKTLLAHQAMR